MPIVYATNVQRWTNDHRVEGAPYLLTTDALADAHVRAGWATRQPPTAPAPAAPAAPVATKKASGSAGRSSLLAEGNLSAVPAEQGSE